jgi:hypothetical protein
MDGGHGRGWMRKEPAILRIDGVKGIPMALRLQS